MTSNPLDIFRAITDFIISPERLVFYNNKLVFGSNLDGYNRRESIKAPYLEGYPTDRQAWGMIRSCVTKKTNSFSSLEAFFFERKTSLFDFVCFDGEVIAISVSDQLRFSLHTTPAGVSPARYSLSVDSRKIALVSLTGLSEKEVTVYETLNR